LSIAGGRGGRDGRRVHCLAFSILKPEADWEEFDRDFLDFRRVVYAQ
jgi:hypothetical protein